MITAFLLCAIWLVKKATTTEKTVIPSDKIAGINPMNQLDAPMLVRNSCKNVDSIRIGIPNPQNHSTAEMPIVLRRKNLFLCSPDRYVFKIVHPVYDVLNLQYV